MAVEKYTEGRRPDGGRIYSPEYHAWRHMIQRCTMPQTCSYKTHGARGIRVCAEWMGSFDAFLLDMGKRPQAPRGAGRLNLYSLERINNDGNYEPTNCKWGTWSEQMRNRRGWAKPKPPRRVPASRFLGVSRLPAKGRWLAKVCQTYVGIFRDECDAATAYNFAAVERWGEKARMNA